MTGEPNTFDAYSIREEIGYLADSEATDEKFLQTIRAALNGPCQTSDKGLQLFVVDLRAVGQFNVDTSELIWPVDPSRDFIQNDEIPLSVIVNQQLWKQLQDLWEKKDPVSWTAFVWRIAVPLANRLNIVGSWRRDN